MTTTQAFADRVARLPCAACGAEIDVADVEPLSTIACPYCRAEITVPGVVGSLELRKLLGRGAAGIVYEAYDHELKKEVAVKVFLRGSAAGPNSVDVIEKCLIEARAMRALSHPNIVQIYKVAQKGERPFIVMELLTGDRLDTVIAEHWLVEEHRALGMAIDIAGGLKAVHDAGFAHLDVKPANIQMDGQGICKLMDYDTARSLRHIEEQGAGLVGTPYYVAPEIIRKAPVDFRADMYSLGATLFHLIAQRPPFQGETSRDVVQERLKRPAMNLRSIRPDVSAETSAVIARMLAPDPQDRYDNYGLLLADLHRAQALALASAMRPPAAAGRRRGLSLRPPVVAAIAAATVALIAMLVWWSTRPPGEPAPGKQQAQAPIGSYDAGDVQANAVTPDRAAPKPPPAIGDAGDARDPIKPIIEIPPAPPDAPATKEKPLPAPPVVAPPVVDPPPVKPQPAPMKRDAGEVDGWIAGKDVTLTFKPGLLTVWGTGGEGSEPSIRAAGIKGPGNSPEPSIVEIRLKASGEGEGKLWWLSETFPLFSDTRIKTFDIRHDSKWHNYIIPVHAKGQAVEIRLDFGTAAGIFEIEWIKFYANGATDTRPTQEWRFEERP